MTSFQLNGRTFVRGKRAVVDTLFNPDGTASGYYEVHGKEVKIFKPSGELDGVITAAGVLAKATKLADGRTWYSHADLDMIGRWDSFMRRREEIDAARAIAFAP
jgi:hypothetical protein